MNDFFQLIKEHAIQIQHCKSHTQWQLKIWYSHSKNIAAQSRSKANSRYKITISIYGIRWNARRYNFSAAPVTQPLRLHPCCMFGQAPAACPPASLQPGLQIPPSQAFKTLPGPERGLPHPSEVSCCCRRWVVRSYKWSKFCKARFYWKFRKCDLTKVVGKVHSVTFQMNGIQNRRRFWVENDL